MLFGIDPVQAEFSPGLSRDTATPPLVESTIGSKAELQTVDSGTVREQPAKAPVAKVTRSEAEDLVNGLQVASVKQVDGEGSITGRVVDEDGAPLANVVVRLNGRGSNSMNTTSPASVGQGAPELPSLTDAVRIAAQRHKTQRANSRETETDGQGGFRFEKLEDRKWSVSAFAVGYIVKADSSYWDISVGSEVDFTAKKVLGVQVEVLMPDGSSADKAHLNVRPRSDQGRMTNYEWSAEEPFLRLVEDRYDIRCYSSDADSLKEAELASETQKLDLKAGQTPEGLTFQLVSRNRITGRIEAPKEYPSDSQFMIRLMGLSEGQEVDLKALGDSEKEAWGRPGAEFSFTDLDPGRYVIGAAIGWSGKVVCHQVLELSSGAEIIILEIPPLDGLGALRVTVSDDQGKPLDGVNFSVRKKRDGGSSSNGVNAIQTRDAAYMVTIPQEMHDDYFGATPAGTQFSVSVRHNEYGAREIPLTPGQTELAVSFVAPGVLIVEVPGYAGSDYEGRLSLSIDKKSGEMGRYRYSGSRRDRIDSEGVRIFEGLEPGMYSITMQLTSSGSRRSRSRSQQVASIEVQVRGGENRAQIPIPSLYPLRVHWSDGKEGSTLRLSRIDVDGSRDSMGRKDIDAAGIAMWEDLPAGQYSLVSRSNGSSMMDIMVPTGEIEFIPKVVNAYRVTVTNVEGAFAKAGFVDGDLIIGAGGKEFATQAEFQVVFQRMRVKTEEIDLLVLRGSKRVTIPIKGGDSQSWRNTGVSFEPATR
ncbi:MAG: hypothetical protein GY930_19445 [bacterium]|nr:hypothetical protein [bacterium]